MGGIGWGPGTWPSSSPDLNPIKNLWHILRGNIRKRKRQPQTGRSSLRHSCRSVRNWTCKLLRIYVRACHDDHRLRLMQEAAQLSISVNS
jgi:hypothetical protein